MKNVLIIHGHPDEHRFNDALSEAYAEGCGAGAQVTHLRLGRLSFDPILRGGYDHPQPLEPDLLHARELIERADHVVWFMPTWWMGPPALVKGFIDRVFLPGWAFRYRAGQKLPERLLVGRSARVVVTMDSPSIWYTLTTRRSLHGAFVNGTLKFVGFGPVRTSTFYSLRSSSQAQRTRALESLRREATRDMRLRMAPRALTEQPHGA